ncbi:hypothetical protein D3C73_1519680 [compost metagenome]
MLLPAHRHAVGVGDEQHAERHVNGGAIEVEGVTGRQDQTDALFGATEFFQFLQQAWQGAFRGRRSQDNENLILDVLEESPQAEA